jgi:leukotriene-A4 hydrolase
LKKEIFAMKTTLAIIFIILMTTFTSLAQQKDIHSYGNPQTVKVTHVDLDWNVLFDKKIIQGSATLTVVRTDKLSPLILDSRDLNIEKVEMSADGKSFKATTFGIGTADKFLGSAVTVQLSPDAKFVRVYYSTSPNASGLQWLSPEQTAGKKSPYMFSQAQAIHARSFIPLQDSPAIRVTYNARVRTPKNLSAVMSSETNPQNAPRTGDYRFKMTKAIPSYLIAIAVGDITFQSLGKRTGVYTEPSMLKKAAWELADTEKMVDATEKIFGPYRWGRYDLLVLPPSFPFGGMENPCLTFATPTIIAGDKSLVSLVAHELAHSWSGNLVTNATWRDFWLNEGFTTYAERRIIEAVYGVKRREMEATLGKQSLIEELKETAKPDQIMHVNLDGRDPDDGFTGIPYEKGALFLRLLEEKYGRVKFDKFVRGYFDSHAFQSITTETFKEYLKKHLLDVENSPEYIQLIKNREIKSKQIENLLKEYTKDSYEVQDIESEIAKIEKKLEQLRQNSVSEAEINEWIEQAGLPENAPSPMSDAFTKVEANAKNWLDGKTKLSAIPVTAWTTQEWLRFLKSMPESLGNEKMSELDKTFGLTKKGNSEIAFQWLLMSIKNNYHAADERLEEFLTSIGRRKFVRPLYAALAETSAGKTRANAIYAKARSGYHPITQTAIDAILKK